MVCTNEPKNKFKGIGEGKLTSKRQGRPAHLTDALLILRLPNSPDTIELCVVQIEDGVARAGEGVVLQAADGKVAGRVDLGLAAAHVAAVGGGRVGILPAVRALLEAGHVRAVEQVLDVASTRLPAPVQIDVACQAARVVAQRALVLARLVAGQGRYGQGAGGGEDVGRQAEVNLRREIRKSELELAGIGE